MSNKRVLIITGILPNPYINNKKNENDVILVTEDKIKEYHYDIEFKYLFTFANSNKLLAKLSSKWKSYYEFKKIKNYKLRGRVISGLPIYQLPKKFKRTPLRKILFNISFWLNRKKIDRIVKEFAPSVVHAQKIDVAGYFAKKISEKYDIPYIITLRNARDYNLDNLETAIINSANELIALSPFLKKEITPYTNKEIQVIPHGIDEGLFKLNEGKIKNKPIKFITVARLLDWKNIDKVIECFSKINESFIYDIYGEGPEYEKLATLIDNVGLHDKVSLRGVVPYENMPKIYNEYDVFILLSFPETFGRVYIEAMSCGLPIIASKGAGMDGIISNGKEGFLIDHTDERAVINSIKHFLSFSDDITKFREEALQLASNYSWSSIANKLYNIYKNY